MSELPKLTAEVFSRKDCPEWANYAAVDSNGFAYWHEQKPTVNKFCGFWECDPPHYIVSLEKFDSSDWENSLVAREHTGA